LPAAAGSESVTSRWSVEEPLESAARFARLVVLPTCVEPRTVEVEPPHVSVGAGGD
jgi:hypothetical protein